MESVRAFCQDLEEQIQLGRRLDLHPLLKPAGLHRTLLELVATRSLMTPIIEMRIGLLGLPKRHAKVAIAESIGSEKMSQRRCSVSWWKIGTYSGTWGNLAAEAEWDGGRRIGISRRPALL
jgi:hypothetical protein